MATRKSRTKKTEVEPKVEALTLTEMLELDRGHATVRAVVAEEQLLRAQRAALIAKIDPSGNLNRIDVGLLRLKEEYAKTKAVVSEVTRAIETRLGIKLSEFSYDDRTGTLHRHDPTPPTGGEPDGLAEAPVPKPD